MIMGTMYDDDIYYDEVSVCVSQKIITSHFQNERRRREVSRLPGLADLGRLWPSDDNDGDECLHLNPMIVFFIDLHKVIH